MSQSSNTSTERTASLRAAQWLTDPDVWAGHFDGRDLGTNATVLAFSTDEIGVGPSLHVHPYDEIFMVRKGHSQITIGERRIQASAGDVVLGPAGVPHKYHNLGPGSLETLDTHLSDHWIQTELDDPETGPD